MSRYVTPFLIFNLGAEMVFVIAQRLEAQSIPHEKSTIVLDEIISVLVSNQLVAEILKPQAVYSRTAAKNLIEDIAQSSAMRLDPTSMDKLWDLITMIYKWQVTLTTDLIKLTLRHLYEIENYVTNPKTHLQLHKVQNLISNFNKILTPIEKIELRDKNAHWLRDYNVRVSLLLRMGLQDVNGNFVTEALDPFSAEMLRNLGENIYSVTSAVKVPDQSHNEKKSSPANTCNANVSSGVELQMLADQLLGTDYKEPSCGMINRGNNVLRLAINKCSEGLKGGCSNTKLIQNIDLNIRHEQKTTDMQDLLDKLTLNENIVQENFCDELINIMEQSTT